MSDHPGIRKAAGILLMLLAAAMALLPALLQPGPPETAFRAENAPWVLRGIELEHADEGFPDPVQVNRADLTELMRLPGIGPAYAERILEERDRNGPFWFPEDLEAVSGIGPQTVLRLREALDWTDE